MNVNQVTATTESCSRKTRQSRIAALVIVALSLFAGVPKLTASTLITFDDLPAPLASEDMPRPYHGLIFSASPYDGIRSSDDPSQVIGVHNGVVSGNNVLLSSGQSNGIVPYLAEQGALFTFESAYFTAAVENVLRVQALGFTRDSNRSAMLESIFTVTNTGPTLVALNWANLTSLELTGLPDGIYFDNRFVMDDLRVDTVPLNADAPEPGTITLLGIGSLLVILGRRSVARRRGAASCD